MSGRFSFGTLVLGNQSLSGLQRLAKECEDWGFEYFWLADERFFRDVYAGLAACAQATQHIKLGTGVTDPYSRHPAITAMGITTIDELSGGRAVLGIGAGIAGFSEMGIAHKHPAKTIRESIELIRKLLTNDTVTYEGEHVHFKNGVLSVPARPDLPIFIAGKGPLNIQLAGEIADGLIISSCVADSTIRHTRSLIAKGASRANRDASEIALASRVNFAVSDDGNEARQAVKPMLAALLVSKKPDFAFIEQLGLSMSPQLTDAVMRTSYGHNRDEMQHVADLIPGEFVDCLAVAGTPDQVTESICRMQREGVSQFIAYPIPSGDQSRKDVLRRLAMDVMPAVTGSAE